MKSTNNHKERKKEREKLNQKINFLAVTNPDFGFLNIRFAMQNYKCYDKSGRSNLRFFVIIGKIKLFYTFIMQKITSVVIFFKNTAAHLPFFVTSFVLSFLQKYTKKETYILFDNLYERNAECIDTYCIFRYMQKHNIKSYYVLWRENPLYKQLKKEKLLKDVIVLKKSVHENLGKNYELFYKIFFKLIHTKVIISSFGNVTYNVTRFFVNNKYINYIGTNHGPYLLKTFPLETKFCSPEVFNKVLCVNSIEKELLERYNFKSENLPVIGIPRWELLKKVHNDQKQIFMMFTWRHSFGVWNKDRLSIKDTKYYRGIQDLIYNEKFNKLLKENNVKLIYTLHHSMIDQTLDYKNVYFDNIEYVPSQNISQYIGSSDLFITDYSSLFFDFAFLNTPIIFYHPDFDDNTLDELDRGDFVQVKSVAKYMYNYCDDVTSVVNLIEKYIKNSFRLEPENIEKMNRLFYTKQNITQKFVDYLENLQ